MKKWATTLALMLGLTWCFVQIFTDETEMESYLMRQDESFTLPDNTAYSSNTPELSIQFLNVASVKIGVGDDKILTDPFYSNSPLSDILTLRKLVPDIVATRRLVSEPQMIDAVLLGHGHYDHILDLPALMAVMKPEAVVVGNDTIKNMLSEVNSLPGANSWISLTKRQLATHKQEGQWISLPGSDTRVLPILSEHAPQIPHVVFAEGMVDQPMSQLPKNVLQWKNGVPITYLIEMGDYTLYFQSSASNEPLGHITERQRNAVGNVDVAILCVASFENVEDYPEHIVTFYRPKHLILIHWEQFWHPRNTDEPDLIPRLDMEQFIRRAKAAADYPLQISMPLPGVTLRFNKN